MPALKSTSEATRLEEVDTHPDGTLKTDIKVRLTTFLAVVLLLSSAAVAVIGLMHSKYTHRAEVIQIQTVERELKASARLKGLDVTNIKVYRSVDGLRASWNQGLQVCTDVALKEPAQQDDLYGTDSVDSDTGKCVTSTSSRGLTPGG
jgi:hypothetical protein